MGASVEKRASGGWTRKHDMDEKKWLGYGDVYCDRGCQRCLAGINVSGNRARARSTWPSKCEARGDDKRSRRAGSLPNDNSRCMGGTIGRRVSERDFVKPVSSGESIVNNVIVARRRKCCCGRSSSGVSYHSQPVVSHCHCA